MPSYRRFALAALALVFACGAMTPAAHAEDPPTTGEKKPVRHPVLWEATKGDTVVYLLGTIHVPDPRVLKLLPEVEEALKRSSALYTELDMSPMGMQKMQMAGLQRARGGPGYSMKAKLGDELFERVKKVLHPMFAAQMPMLDGMKVWMLVPIISQSELMKLGLQGTTLDASVWARAEKAGKAVAGLEKVEEQLDVFDQLTDDEQVQMVATSLDHMAKDKDGMKKLIDLYVTGDVEKIEAYLKGAFGEEAETELAKKLLKSLIDDRNHRMVERLLKKLEGKPDQTVMVAVGTAHMPGDHGVLPLLRKQGFEVRRILSGTRLKEPKAAPAGK